MASIAILIVSIGLNLSTFMANSFVFERSLEVGNRIEHIQQRYDEISCVEFIRLSLARDPYFTYSGNFKEYFNTICKDSLGR